MSRLFRFSSRAAFAASAGLAVVLLAASPALAHECFVASRSAQGDASAGAHSQAWDAVSLDTLLTEFIGLPPDLAQCVEDNATQFGIPSSFVFGGKQAVGQDGVIAEHNPNMDSGLSSNGKGIDHAEQVFGPSIGAAIGFCSGGGA
jgi:hypothetical protein